MYTENCKVESNHEDAVYQHLGSRFAKLAELIDSKSISCALILKEMEAIQIVIHASNEIKSNSDRVNSIIQNFNGAGTVRTKK